MPRILIKRVDDPNYKFSLGDLAIGELGLNTATGRIFTRKGKGIISDTVVEMSDPVARLGFKPYPETGGSLKGTLVAVQGNGSNPPIKIPQGGLTTTPQIGAIEFDGARLYLTNNGGIRKSLIMDRDNIGGMSDGWTNQRRVTFNGDVNGSFLIDGTSDVNSMVNLTPVMATGGDFGNEVTSVSLKVNDKGQITSIRNTPIKLTTADITENPNGLYYTTTRARAAVSASGDLTYDVVTGVFRYDEPVYHEVATTGSYDDLDDTPVFKLETAFTSNESEIFSFDAARYMGAKANIIVKRVDRVYMFEAMFLVDDNLNCSFVRYAIVGADADAFKFEINQNKEPTFYINSGDTVTKIVVGTVTMITRR